MSWFPMSVVLFWVFALPCVIATVVYPLIVARRARRLPHVSSPQASDFLNVCVIVAAYNEEDVIERRIRNLLEQDYPPERLRVVIVSDASTDETDEIVAGFADERVTLMRMPERIGKTAALCDATVRVSGAEVLVFSDANTIFDRSTIARLAEWFADPAIGCVCGNLRYTSAKDPGSAAIAEGESRYWSWDARIKLNEGVVGRLLGGAGAVLALRPSLAIRIPSGQSNDMIWPIWARRCGYLAVFDPDALAYEETAGSAMGEFRRRKRIVVRGLAGVAYALRLLLTEPSSCFRKAGFRERLGIALELLAKKLCRYLTFPCLIAMVCFGAFAPGGVTLFLTRLIAGSLIVGGLAGWVEIKMNRRLGPLPDLRYSAAMAAAACVGFFQFCTGQGCAVWRSERK